MRPRGNIRPILFLAAACALVAALCLGACAHSDNKLEATGTSSGASLPPAVSSGMPASSADPPSESASEQPVTTSSSAASSEQGASQAAASLAEVPAADDAQTPGVEGQLVVQFVDVGQGDCALLACNGHYALIDGGPREASQIVYTVLDKQGIDHLDFIIATHADADHIYGISAALNAASCDVCYCSVLESDTDTFANMKRYVEQGGGTLQVPQVPTTLQLGDATCTVIGPVRSFEDDNEGSLVCRVDFGATSFLFMGDAGYEAEDALLAAGANVKADVIKVGHHGAASTTSARFLAAVAPRDAVISVGSGNGYGHPTKETLDALAASGCIIYRTDQMGDVVATSDGSDVLFSIGAKRATGGDTAGAGGEAAEGASAADGAAAAPDPTSPGGAGEFKYSDMKEFMDHLPEGTVFVYNKGESSHKLHKLDCPALKQMKSRNAVAVSSLDELPAEWEACGTCCAGSDKKPRKNCP